ncbi:KH domain-containing protein [Peribacillus psychrosaccharolyticus]|uniref:RNA-binding protein KhpA n=1 Tax=Peribacillus psychrosaccharolyticus TaxID=1407 RepID=A0A974S2N8_PERPY|nr:KH domain-containing protein [Peribacillus psychrosaccharolyticus]MEC2053761.1 KH domain-containing protein [Peribacillus psychrosaccharolyticus]MED3742624.1 KH domain-containing protein [Peribacillus psychrosaccharolyticus]QQT01570.1 KH domain-containing protein [Peribacillus psychrosaccharolyticus]
MKALIETIVSALVDYPEDVQVTERDDDGRTVYSLSVNKADMGKVIGKQGRIAKAIRTVVYAAGSSQHKKIYLEISE